MLLSTSLNALIVKVQSVCIDAMAVSKPSYSTVEPLLKDTPNKGHNTFDLSIKDKFCSPYRTMAIQFYL